MTTTKACNCGHLHTEGDVWHGRTAPGSKQCTTWMGLAHGLACYPEAECSRVCHSAGATALFRNTNTLPWLCPWGTRALTRMLHTGIDSSVLIMVVSQLCRWGLVHSTAKQHRRQSRPSACSSNPTAAAAADIQFPCWLPRLAFTCYCKV